MNSLSRVSLLKGRSFKQMKSKCFQSQSLLSNKTSLNIISTRKYHEPYQKKDGDIKIEFPNAFKAHKCDLPLTHSYTNKEEVLKYFKDMFIIRRMELVCDIYYKQKKIWGFCHLYDGQEAVCVGIEGALKKGDHIITAYRDHAWQYTRGDTLRSIFAEFFGKETGCARGKGGSMHLYFPANNFYGGNGIVGAQVPLGTGIALGSKLKGDKTLCITAYGDGAANQGQVFEAYNIAKLWNLPVVYLCENNKYGMGTAANRASASDQFYTRGDYIPGLQVDGMDLFAVREAMRYCTDWCRSDKGPIIIEAKTYRYHGHSMSDPGISYRHADEVQEYRSKFDPIRRIRNIIIENSWATEDELKEMEKDMRKQVEDEAKQAEQDGMLGEEELVLDIYTTGPPKFVRYSNYPDSLIDGKKRIRDIFPNYYK